MTSYIILLICIISIICWILAKPTHYRGCRNDFLDGLGWGLASAAAVISISLAL